MYVPSKRGGDGLGSYSGGGYEPLPISNFAPMRLALRGRLLGIGWF